MSDDPREVSVLASLADQYALAADPPYSFAFRDLAIALRDLGAQREHDKATIEVLSHEVRELRGVA